MSCLKTLTFSSTNELAPSSIEKKRFLLINKLKEQLSLIDNPNLTKSRKRWVKIEGDRVLEEVTINVRPWWKETIDGKVMFFVRSGLKRIEFEKDKSAIVLNSIEELPPLIRGLIDATGTGELDHLLAGG